MHRLALKILQHQSLDRRFLDFCEWLYFIYISSLSEEATMLYAKHRNTISENNSGPMCRPPAL